MDSYANLRTIAIFVAYTISSLLCSPIAVLGSNSSSVVALDNLIRTYAKLTIPRQRTGVVYDVQLPANVSGITASVLKLRSRTLWSRGVNFTSFRLRPRVITRPYAKRVTLVHQDFGNWSSLYFQVPNYSLITPVIGFGAYDASNFNTPRSQKLELRASGNNTISISIRFPHVDAYQARRRNATLKCVTFVGANKNDTLELRNMTGGRHCCATRRSYGHFAIAVLDEPEPNKKRSKPTMDDKWWFLVGFVIGIVALCVVGTMVYFLLRKKKMREMERASEKGVAIETVLINNGRSRMPCASMVRTQPCLEHHDYVSDSSERPL